MTTFEYYTNNKSEPKTQPQTTQSDNELFNNMNSHFCNSHPKIMTKIQKLTMHLFSFPKGITFHHSWVTIISVY